jgi:16S rRNA (uracil1498-N3)-methyltransferase
MASAGFSKDFACEFGIMQLNCGMDPNETTAELTDAGGKIRLYVTSDLVEGLAVPLSDSHAHYLLHVMRAGPGVRLRLFNGRDGEWLAKIAQVTKRGIVLRTLVRSAPQVGVPDIWLVFAPVKKVPADYLVQKATELGAGLLQPVFTRRTIVTRINEDRLTANAIEAAEQSERLSVPQIGAAVSLESLFSTWPKERRLFFCDEAGEAKPLAHAAGESSGPAAILTGPEGGFDPVERETLRALSFVTPVTLGPRILRADTAALAALAVWQSVRGDWI